jgi:hypothetical protein
MTTDEIISALEEIKRTDPERFYNALGFGDEGANIMHSFVSGSYELGLIAGAKWMDELRSKLPDHNRGYVETILSVPVAAKMLLFMNDRLWAHIGLDPGFHRGHVRIITMRFDDV